MATGLTLRTVLPPPSWPRPHPAARPKQRGRNGQTSSTRQAQATRASPSAPAAPMEINSPAVPPIQT